MTEILFWLSAITVVAVVCGRIVYNVGRVAGRIELLVGVPAPGKEETESPEFCGFLKTLPRTRPSGTRTQERGYESTE